MTTSNGWANRRANQGLLLSLCLLISGPSVAETLRIAVAANFKPTVENLAEVFSRDTSTAIDISLGSTGALYAQIKHGAPFHIFFAADVTRPERLDREGLTRRREVYALGRLVYWQPGAGGTDRRSVSSALTTAIANPRHAPYGAAAETVLHHLGVTPRLVTGNNVAQAFAFVATGNVPAGFVSLSQVRAKSISPTQYWVVPGDLHQPIQQELVVMKTAPSSADRFVDFIITATDEMTEAGYLVPGHNPDVPG